MILFAPNVYVARYLRETGQLKPEIMAKAEHLMLVGYQRELTYRRHDGSFSAFGDSDPEGSLWLTAFVLKTFAEAKALMYIDQAVIDAAAAWIVAHQRGRRLIRKRGLPSPPGAAGRTAGPRRPDGLRGHRTDGGGRQRLRRQRRELPGRPAGRYGGTVHDGDNRLCPAALRKSAPGSRIRKADVHGTGGRQRRSLLERWRTAYRAAGTGQPRHGNRSAAIEATGYALLALLGHDDFVSASRAAKWLVGQRNALGGFGSTQDTIVSLPRPDRLLDKGPVGRRHDRSPGERHLAQGGAHRA